MGHTMEHNSSCEEGYHHHAMRHFLPLLAVPVAIGVLRGMSRRRHMFMHMHGHDNWENGVPPFFAEWHRRAHEAPQKPAEPEVKES